MLNQETLKENWNSIADAVREKFGQISSDELARVQGNLEQLFGLLQRKTGQSREQVEQFVGNCCHAAGSTISNAMDTATGLATEAARYVSKSYEQAAEQAERGLEYARESVEHRPMESVAVVAGASLLAGVIIGLSLNRR